MKNRATLVGVLVLGLVAAGVYFVRSRATVPAGPGAGALSGSGHPGAMDDALPDVTLAEGTADLDGVRLRVSVLPNPPVAFAKFIIRVSAFGPAPTAASSGGAAAEWPLALEGGRVSFEMTMPMGDHRYSLVPAGQGGYEAEVVLPLCKSGKRRWYATVEGTASGRPVTARFRLDLAVPSSAPAP